MRPQTARNNVIPLPVPGPGGARAMPVVVSSGPANVRLSASSPYDADARTQRRLGAAALGISALINLLIILLLASVNPPPPKMEQRAGAPIEVNLSGLDPEPPAAAAPRQQQRLMPRRAENPRSVPPPTRADALPPPVPNAPPPIEPQPQRPRDVTELFDFKPQPRAPQQPQEDFMADMKRRQGASTPQAAAEESEASRAARNAAGNIAALTQKGMRGNSETGGVFTITEIGLRRAEFTFNGFENQTRGRFAERIAVEQGSEVDVRVAIVKEMIRLIRRFKTGDFVWESRRLGKDVTLSARPADDTALFNFLMLEMFPEDAKRLSRP